MLCAGSPASGLLFTCYLVLPPLRYPWKTRPGEQSASTAELEWARSCKDGKEGLEGLSTSAHAKIPKFLRMISARAQHLQRSEKKNLGDEKMKRNAEVAGNGIQGWDEASPHSSLSFQTGFKNGRMGRACPACRAMFHLSASARVAWRDTGFWKCKFRL